MKIYTKKSELQEYLTRLQHRNTIGFAPTMGALHEGHLSLLDKAMIENDISVVSIFINPTQFNNTSDFDNYPRDFEHDILLLGERNCNVLFLPELHEIYPENNIHWIDIDLGFIEKTMEGKYRPGHFRGVKTVVYQLLDIIKPLKAYFGEKDYQQMLVIREMIKKLNLPVQIITCETKREHDGLAMSSRNRRLSAEERIAASKIPVILKGALKLLKTETTTVVSSWVREQFAETPELRLQYFEICDQETLKPASIAQPGKVRLFTAVFAGDIRLIDNMLFEG